MSEELKCSVPGCDRTFKMKAHQVRHETSHRKKAGMSATSTSQPAPVKRGPGRPRKTIDASAVLPDLDQVKRGPGRPKGSKTRAKAQSNGQVNDHLAAVRQVVLDLHSKREALARELAKVDDTLAQVKELVNGG